MTHMFCYTFHKRSLSQNYRWMCGIQESRSEDGTLLVTDLEVGVNIEIGSVSYQVVVSRDIIFAAGPY